MFEYFKIHWDFVWSTMEFSSWGWQKISECERAREHMNCDGSGFNMSLDWGEL